MTLEASLFGVQVLEVKSKSYSNAIVQSLVAMISVRVEHIPKEDLRGQTHHLCIFVGEPIPSFEQLGMPIHLRRQSSARPLLLEQTLGSPHHAVQALREQESSCSGKDSEAMYVEQYRWFEAARVDLIVNSTFGWTACSLLVLKEEVAIEQL